MTGLSTNIWIISLNVNGLNTPTKEEKLGHLQETLNMTLQTDWNENMEKKFFGNINQKKGIHT